jgi:hypothetical protein
MAAEIDHVFKLVDDKEIDPVLRHSRAQRRQACPVLIDGEGWRKCQGVGHEVTFELQGNGKLG